MIRKILERWAWRLYTFFGKYARPWPAELVLNIVHHTSGLALGHDGNPESVQFAPLKGVIGGFKLSGNALPVLEYEVFDKKLMEFIAIRVEFSQPDRMDFIATIRSNTPALGEPPGGHCRNGEVVPATAPYREPGLTLLHHLHRYFPYARPKMKVVETPKVSA